MKKLLISVLFLLLTMCLASCANNTIEPPVTPDQSLQSEDPALEEETGPRLMQVNIYHLGIITELDLADAETQALAERLLTLLETAATEDSMDTAPEDSPNPIQVTAGRTALELVYTQAIELPFKNGETMHTARRLLYSVPYINDDGGLLYIGEDIYQELPLGKLFDQDLQQTIYNSASDQVEKAVLSASGNQVEINGQSYDYEAGENAADLPDMLLSRMLYRSIAFYLNAYTGNVAGLQMMSTSALTDALLAASNGATTENKLGEETVVNLNKYILVDYFLPQTIFAPVAKDDGFAVTLYLNEQAQIEVHFTVQEDMPLVNSMHLVISDPTGDSQ